MPQNFLRPNKQIVRPAQVGRQAGLLQNGFAHGESRDQRDERSLLRRNRRAQQHGHVDAVCLFRVPGVPGAAAPRRLFLGDDDGAVRLPSLAQRHGDGIGRVNFEKMVDAFAERPRMQPPVQQLRRKNVGDLFDLVAGARMALHADAQRAQLFDPAPHGARASRRFRGRFSRR